jgi:hypothetical protein
MKKRLPVMRGQRKIDRKKERKKKERKIDG